MTRNVKKDRTQMATYRTTVPGRANRLINNAKDRAKRRNIEFNITAQWVENKLILGFCELTGLAFDLSISKNTKDNPFAPSLDRIDSSMGYTENNTRVILWSVNRALGQEGFEILRPVFKKLAEL